MARDIIRTSIRKFDPVGPDAETREKMRAQELRFVDRAAKRATLRARFMKPTVNTDPRAPERWWLNESGALRAPAPTAEPSSLLSVGFTLTGTALGVHSLDQWSIFNHFSDRHMSESVFGDVKCDANTWTPAMVASMFRLQPRRLVNLLFIGDESVLDSMSMMIVRRHPFSDVESSDMHFLASYRASHDYQCSRLQVPINAETLDGLTFIRLLSTARCSAPTIRVVASLLA